MAVSESAARLRAMIEKAMEDHRITRDERDRILAIASEDGHIDQQEQSLLDLLQDMIGDGSVRLVP